MSVELELLMVKDIVLKKYIADPMIQSIWIVGGMLNNIGTSENPDLSELEEELSWRFEDAAELAVQRKNIQKLAKLKELPTEHLYMGSEWNRLADFFEREPREQKRTLLLSAFYGFEPLGISVETSYGECRLVPAEKTAKIAAELRRVDLAYLNKLGQEKFAFPFGQPSSPEREAEKMANLAKAFGLPTPAQGTKIDFAASSSRDVSHSPLEAEDFDLETIDTLVDFYERADDLKCGVLCGIV